MIYNKIDIGFVLEVFDCSNRLGPKAGTIGATSTGLPFENWDLELASIRHAWGVGEAIVGGGRKKRNIWTKIQTYQNMKVRES